MAFKKSGNQFLKIIGATVMCIFSLMVCFCGVFAWFVSKTSQNNTGSNFAVENVGQAVSNITFYEFDSIQEDNEISYYTFKAGAGEQIDVNIVDDVATPTKPLALNQYSLENPHQPLLMLLELRSDRLKINLETEHYYMADGDHDHIASTDNYLSSVISFYSILFKSSGATSIDTRKGLFTNKIAIGVDELINQGTNKNMSSFVKFDNMGEYDSFDQEITIFDDFATESNYLAIVIDYYSVFVEYIYSHFMGNEYLDQIGGLPFSCDWVTTL